MTTTFPRRTGAKLNKRPVTDLGRIGCAERAFAALPSSRFPSRPYGLQSTCAALCIYAATFAASWFAASLIGGAAQ